VNKANEDTNENENIEVVFEPKPPPTAGIFAVNSSMPFHPPSHLTLI
jgi:hypothetical protein